MLASVLLSHDAPVTVFDLGMTPIQLGWLRRQPVDVISPDLPSGHRFHAGRWPLWVKPALFAQSPYDVTLWLDSDLIVRRDLAPLLEMARDRGAAYFPDSFARPDVLLNRPPVYDLHPVPEVFPSVNSGVVAFRRGEPWIGRAAGLLGEVIAGVIPADSVAGWDQGLFKVAWEEAGIRPVDDPSWNRPGWTLAEMGRPLSPDEVFARSAPGEITHFQAGPKPWTHWGEFPLSLRPAPDLTVLILGHEPFNRPEREWLRPINLTDRDPDQSWGESRVYDLPIVDAIETEYVGLATFSWVKKYDSNGMLSPWEFGELDLKPDRVWCAQRTDDRSHLPYADWADHIEHFNPGVKPLIEELRRESGRKEIGPACWSNNFVMARGPFQELKAFYREWMARFRERYPACPYEAVVPAKCWGYLAEAIGVHWLASRPGLEFIEMKARPIKARVRLGARPPGRR